MSPIYSLLEKSNYCDILGVHSQYCICPRPVYYIDHLVLVSSSSFTAQINFFFMRSSKAQLCVMLLLLLLVLLMMLSHGLSCNEHVHPSLSIAQLMKKSDRAVYNQYKNRCNVRARTTSFILPINIIKKGEKERKIDAAAQWDKKPKKKKTRKKIQKKNGKQKESVETENKMY